MSVPLTVLQRTMACGRTARGTEAPLAAKPFKIINKPAKTDVIRADWFGFIFIVLNSLGRCPADSLTPPKRKLVCVANRDREATTVRGQPARGRGHEV